MYCILLFQLLLCIILIYVHFLCSVLPSIVLNTTLYKYKYVCKSIAHKQLSSLVIDFVSAISLRTQPIAASLRSTIWFGGNGLRWVPPS